MTDKNISLISNIIAQKMVWESIPSFEKAAYVNESFSFIKSERKIWGIGVSYHNSSKILELYVSHNYDTDNLRRILKKINIGFRFKKTKGFESYVVSKQKASIISGNPAKHYKLNGWGTLGGYVTDNLSNYRLAISNNHVFGLLNKAKVNDKILYDNGAEIITIGGFYRKVDLLMPPSVNIVDAAVGWINEDIKLKWARKKPLNSLYPIIGMEVYKIGATTGYTEGFIVSNNLRHRVNYRGFGILNFSNSINILGKGGFPFSLPGDSGSLVFKKKTNEVVGMIFAGDGTNSFANIFNNIETQLQISI